MIVQGVSCLGCIFHVAIHLWPLLYVIILPSIWWILGSLAIVSTILGLWLLVWCSLVNIGLAYKWRIAVHSVTPVRNRLVWWQRLVIRILRSVVWLSLSIEIVTYHVVVHSLLLGLAFISWTEILLDIKPTIITLWIISSNSGWIDVLSGPALVDCVLLDHLVQELFVVCLALDDSSMAIALNILVLLHILEHIVSDGLVALSGLIKGIIVTVLHWVWHEVGIGSGDVFKWVF